MQDNKKNKKFDINEETKEFEFVYKYQTPKENENILLKDIQNNKNEQNRIKNLLNTWRNWNWNINEKQRL